MGTLPYELIASCEAAVELHLRQPISQRFYTGIPAIDAFCTLGVGQRVALLAGTGVGKTTLLRRIAQRANADAQVVALIGERAREAVEIIEGLRNSPRWPNTTIVCTTAADSAMQRFTAARTAMAQAEWLCARGRHVLLTIDSLTRVANAWRELALASGEEAVHRGHPPSMVSALANIVERAGVRKFGSITAIFAVLVEGDDPFEPISDAVRALLDGHIMLSRQLADAGRFPPVDVLRSVSRVMRDVVSEEHFQDALLVRRALSTLENAQDLFAIGAYRRGGDPWLDAVVDVRERLDRWLYDDGSTSGVRTPALIELKSIALQLRASSGPQQSAE